MKLWEVLFRDQILCSPLCGQLASLSQISIFGETENTLDSS